MGSSQTTSCEIPCTPLADTRIARATAGDREAAESLVRSYLPRARNLARVLLGRDAGVDMVARDALLAMLRGLSARSRDLPFERWVDRQVTREALSHLPSMTRDDSVTVRRPDARSLRLATSEASARVPLLAAIDALYDDQRVIVTMHEILRLPLHEVAKELRLPLERVITRYQTGRARIDYLLSTPEPRSTP